MSIGGYPPEWFSEPLDNSLKCGICTKIMRHSRMTPCGHAFCSTCLVNWLDSYKVCPKCRKEVEVESLRHKVQLDTFISGLFTYCKNKRAGCTEQVPLIEKHLHENNCPHRSCSHSANSANSSSSNWRDSAQNPRRGKHKRTNSSVSASSSFASFPTARETAAKRSPSATNLCKIRLTPAAVTDMVST